MESGLKDRYKHTISVSLLMKDRASEIGLDPPIAQCIGLLHNIGYTDRIKTSGFLDSVLSRLIYFFIVFNDRAV